MRVSGFSSQVVVARAHPRVGLLGNPSDLYRGRCLAFTFGQRWALVRLEAAERTEMDGNLLAAGWQVFQGAVRETEGSGGEGQLRARPCRASVETDIPRQAGLAGSSAILTAQLRALSRWHEVALPPERVAEAAWRAESELLGIRAGPMDRLVQAHEGLLFLDCAAPFSDGAIRRLDPALLPPVLIAWDARPGAPSGAIHEPVWQRWQAGDSEVRAVVAEWISLADAGLEALRGGRVEELIRLVDRNFDLRARLFSLGGRDRELIDLGRTHGCGTKFCGSGGAVLAVARSPEDRDAARRAYRAAGFETLVPVVGQAVGERP